jgi:peptide/nickel transport system permease protein
LRTLARHWPKLWLLFWGALALFAWKSSAAHHLARTLQGPELAHPLGFDAFGRDLLGIVLRGSLSSAAFGLLAVLASCVLGVALGASIAVAGARTQFVALRVLDLLLAFPTLLIALGWAAVWGPGWDTLLLALAIGILPSFTRLIYVRSRELLTTEYLLASRALGASSLELVIRHLLPALLSLCSIKLPALFAHALLAEATLSFLGVGAPIGHDTWGSLLAQSRDYLLEAPHLAIGTGIPLVLTVLALQLISEQVTEKSFRTSPEPS